MHLKSFLSALAIAMAVVLGLDYVSLAATGKSLLLGRSNSANAITSLTRTTNGPALSLNSRPGQPGLRVNRPVKVPNLNADRVDGLDSAVFARKQAPLAYQRDDTPRYVAVAGFTTVREIALTVPGECGPDTRHRYLVEHTAWWTRTADALIEVSLTVNSIAHQFGPGTSAGKVAPFANTASSRLLTLAPGPATVRMIADAIGGSGVTATDAVLQVTDLGYDCAGGPVSRPAAGRAPIRPTGR